MRCTYLCINNYLYNFRVFVYFFFLYFFLLSLKTTTKNPIEKVLPISPVVTICSWSAYTSLENRIIWIIWHIFELEYFSFFFVVVCFGSFVVCCLLYQMELCINLNPQKKKKKESKRKREKKRKYYSVNESFILVIVLYIYIYSSVFIYICYVLLCIVYIHNVCITHTYLYITYILINKWLSLMCFYGTNS